MCAGCLGAGAAIVVQGSATVGLAKGGLTRLRERLTGQDPLERRIAAYSANAEFLAELGLQPDRVLGPPPAARLGEETANA